MANNIEISQFTSYIGVDDTTRHINIRRSDGENLGINSAIPRSRLDVRGDAIVSGAVTATSFYGDASNMSGIISLADTQSVNVVGFGTIADLNVINGSFLGGITTIANLQISNVNFSGITTVPTLSVESDTVLNGITTAPDLRSVNINTQNLNVTGISTLGSVIISSGIVSATSGIVTYYGDGRHLQNVISGVGIATESGTVSFGATVINFIGDFVSRATVSSGIATVTLNSINNGILDVNNSGINVSGIVTATRFVGDGSTLTNVVSGVDLRKNGTSVGTGITIINITGGTLSLSASSGSATIASNAAGSDTQVQYRSGGDFAGSSNLTFNGTTLTVASSLTLNSNGIDVSGTTLDRASLRNYVETTINLGNTGTSRNINLANGNVFTATLNGNCTFSFTIGVTSGTSSFTLILTNDGTAGRSITWPASVRWPNNSIPPRTTDAGKTDIWSFFSPNNGSTWYGSIALYNFS
jgi:hypothetical protein